MILCVYMIPSNIYWLPTCLNVIWWQSLHPHSSWVCSLSWYRWSNPLPIFLCALILQFHRPPVEKMHTSNGCFIQARRKQGFTDRSLSKRSHTSGQMQAVEVKSTWEHLDSSRAWPWPTIDLYSVIFTPEFLFFFITNYNLIDIILNLTF